MTCYCSEGGGKWCIEDNFPLCLFLFCFFVFMPSNNRISIIDLREVEGSEGRE